MEDGEDIELKPQSIADRRYRDNCDRIEVHVKPKGIRARFHAVLRGRGLSMREDIQAHILETIAADEAKQREKESTPTQPKK